MLFGRARELAEIEDQLRAALAGDGRLLLVSGEPGIGKTRLAEEVDRMAAGLGMATCWGRATEEEGSPPYWVFRQVVRSLAAAHPDRVAALGPGAEDLTQLAPELSRQPGRPARAGDDSSPHHRPGPPDAEERFRLFETVGAFLAAVASEHGLLVVLDDLQWADAASLLLAGHLARALSGTRLAVLATYRDTEVVGRGLLRDMLASVARQRGVARLRLVGLSPSAVGQQLAALTGRPLADEVIADVSRRTLGNPFFVTELGRVLARRDAEPAGEVVGELPDAVRDAVRGRLSALSGGCRKLVAVASVLGSEVDTSTLAAVAGVDTAEVLARLDEAAEAGIVRGVKPGAYRFAHDLVREAARLDVPTALGLAVHLRAAEHLEQG